LRRIRSNTNAYGLAQHNTTAAPDIPSAPNSAAAVQLSPPRCERTGIVSNDRWVEEVWTEKYSSNSAVAGTRQAATVQRRDCVAVEAQANPLISVFPIGDRFFKTGNKQTAPTVAGKIRGRPEMPNICRDLDTRRLQSQAINKLVAFLREAKKQRNENPGTMRAGRQQKFPGHMVLKSE